MKVKIPLRDSTMKVSKHWLEIDADGSDYTVALCNDKGVIGGGDRTPIKQAFLENLAAVGAGVILKNGPLRFFKTDSDVRVSFTEDEEGEPGFDRLDTGEFDEAIHKALGDGGQKSESHSKRSSTGKKSASHHKAARGASPKRKAPSRRKSKD